MAGIPPTLETDSEDVTWALQTADALWKREERVDAVVWLRRAAQAASDAEDDDRALALANKAAELVEWVAKGPGRDPVAAREAAGPDMDRPLAPQELAPQVEPREQERADPQDPQEGEVDHNDDEATTPHRPLLSAPASSRLRGRPAGMSRPIASVLPPPVQLASIVPTLRPPSRLPSLPPSMRPGRIPPPLPSQAHDPVRTAAQAHAGMLDPWAELDGVRVSREGAGAGASERPPPSRSSRDMDEVVTSAPAPPKAVTAALPSPPEPFGTSGPSSGRQRVASLSVPEGSSASSGTSSSRQRVAASFSIGGSSGVGALSSAASDSRDLESGRELAHMTALHSWPETTLRSLSRDATVRTLARDEEVSGFGLAVVMQGSVDVAATIVDAAADRIHAGAVVRGRGTIDSIAPLRLIATGDPARVATWNEKQVAEAFRSCPTIEHGLRVAGNRIQALVGVTLGPLGDRLDPTLRTDVMNRLELRVVAEHETLARAGEPIPGLVVVGTGEIELLGRYGVREGLSLRSGDFLFPTQVLRAEPAPLSAQGAKGGALVLIADRRSAQELLVTCPQLLEIFAGP
jgi:hypothetical protein